MSLSESISEAMQRIGEAAVAAAKALSACARLFREAAEECATKYSGDVDAFIKDLQLKAALHTAPPRVKHLAQHSKKRRTRKKNANRALREYQRRA